MFNKTVTMKQRRDIICNGSVCCSTLMINRHLKLTYNNYTHSYTLIPILHSLETSTVYNTLHTAQTSTHTITKTIEWAYGCFAYFSAKCLQWETKSHPNENTVKLKSGRKLSAMREKTDYALRGDNGVMIWWWWYGDDNGG